MKLNVEQYKTFLEELAKGKKVDFAEIKSKMANCGPPGVTGTTAVCITQPFILIVRKKLLCA